MTTIEQMAKAAYLELITKRKERLGEAVPPTPWEVLADYDREDWRAAIRAALEVGGVRVGIVADWNPPAEVTPDAVTGPLA
jgi:hypothetical protein